VAPRVCAVVLQTLQNIPFAVVRSGESVSAISRSRVVDRMEKETIHLGLLFWDKVTFEIAQRAIWPPFPVKTTSSFMTQSGPRDGFVR